MKQLTRAERKIFYLLGAAWNAYLPLPELHPDDIHDFRFAIHAAQNIILARGAMRDEVNEEN